MAQANDKTVKLDEKIHRAVKTLASSRGYALQAYIEQCIYKQLCEEFGEGTVNSILDEQSD